MYANNSDILFFALCKIIHLDFEKLYRTILLLSNRFDVDVRFSYIFANRINSLVAYQQYYASACPIGIDVDCLVLFQTRGYHSWVLVLNSVR